MNSGIIEIFKKILDNKFYQTLTSVFFTFITYFFLNNDIAIVKKFGHFWSIIFIFVCWILIIETLLIVWRKINKVYIKLHVNQYRNNQKENENKEILEKLWTEVDKMSNEEKKKLKYFLNNNNQPLLEGNIIYSYNNLLSSDWVHRTEYSGNERITEEINVISNGQTKIEEITYTPKYQYVLKEPIYEALKYSLEKYGKISHFN